MVSHDRPSMSIFATIFRYRGWFVLPLIVVGAAAAVVAAKLPDRYQADVLVLIRPMNFPEAFVKRADMSRIENQIQTLKEVLLSRTLLEQVITEFDLHRELAGRATRDELLKRTRNEIKVQVRWDDVFALSYQADDPETAAAVSNRLAELFVALLKAQVQQVDTSAARIEFLESRMRDLKVRLDDLLVTFTDGYPEVVALRRQMHDLQRELLLARSAPASAGRPADNAAAAAGNGNILFQPQEAQILDAAVPPQQPSGPPRLLIALAGVALGLGAGAGLALARGRLDRSFSEPHDVQDYTGVPVLAVIPRIHSMARRRQRMRLTVALSITAATVALLLYRYLAWPEIGMAQIFGFIR